MRDVEHEQRRDTLRQVLRETKHRLAWRETQPAGLVAFLAQLSRSAGNSRMRRIRAHHPECVLGTSRFRTSGIERRCRAWRRWIDTALDPPHEICEWNAEPVVGRVHTVLQRTVGGSADRRQQTNSGPFNWRPTVTILLQLTYGGVLLAVLGQQVGLPILPSSF